MYVMYQSKEPIITVRDSATTGLKKGEEICSPENIIFWSKDQVQLPIHQNLILHVFE